MADKTTQRVVDQQTISFQSVFCPMICCTGCLGFMVIGISMTLVGALSFNTFDPSVNQPIIIGPIFLLLALACSIGYCVTCRRSPAIPGLSLRRAMRDVMRTGMLSSEMEASEHTIQYTTTVQFGPKHGDADAPALREYVHQTRVTSKKLSLTSGGKESTSTQLL